MQGADGMVIIVLIRKQMQFIGVGCDWPKISGLIVIAKE